VDAFEDELQKITSTEKNASLKDITRAIGKHLPGGKERIRQRLLDKFRFADSEYKKDHIGFVSGALKRAGKNTRPSYIGFFQD
jgi:hypothetical protein